MISLLDSGAYLLRGTEIIPDNQEAASAILSKTGKNVSKEDAKKATIAYGILRDHNTADKMEKLKSKFDKPTILHLSVSSRPHVLRDLPSSRFRMF